MDPIGPIDTLIRIHITEMVKQYILNGSNVLFYLIHNNLAINLEAV